MTREDADAVLADGTVIRVTAGNPTHEDAAALVIALDTGGQADVAAVSTPRPGWLRAARRESVGGRLIGSPTDL